MKNGSVKLSIIYECKVSGKILALTYSHPQNTE